MPLVNLFRSNKRNHASETAVGRKVFRGVAVDFIDVVVIQTL